jgi:hypothetical protein
MSHLVGMWFHAMLIGDERRRAHLEAEHQHRG